MHREVYVCSFHEFGQSEYTCITSFEFKKLCQHPENPTEVHTPDPRAATILTSNAMD